MTQRRYISRIAGIFTFVVAFVASNGVAAYSVCTNAEVRDHDPTAAFEFFEDEPTMMSMKVEAREPDCSTLDDESESDPAFAACYDSVDVPISTVPSLFARHQADRASAGILGRVGEILGHVVEPTIVQPDPDEASVELTPEERIRSTLRSISQNYPKREAACTAVSPESCEKAPALPNVWIPEISFSSATRTELLPETEPLAELTQMSALEHLRVRALVMAYDVPVPPPRV